MFFCSFSDKSLRHVNLQGQLVGISEAKKRRWDLQMTSILGGVGTLQDAIEVWRSNAASQVEGVEPCPICYHIVHTVVRLSRDERSS